jgi:Cdc6-like AAA superfamily ATPase
MNFENQGQPISIIKNDKSKSKFSPILFVTDKKEKAIRPFEELKLNENDGQFQPIPNPETERQILYITGASGSGKSYYTKNYCMEYRRLFPKNPIYLFSSINEDSSIDEIKGLQRIKLTPELLDDEITSADFKDSLVIFDDTDCITDKKMKIKINGILNSILETGRHTNTYCIYTSHLPCAGNDTKRILNEAHTITFFPHSLGGRSLKYLLEGYLGLDKTQIKKIKGLKSRWVSVLKTYPQIVISEKEAYLVSIE